MGDILDICGLLQHIDSHRRQLAVHVEQETDRWQEAANLVLEFESITAHLVSGALFDPAATKSDRSSQFSYSRLVEEPEDIDAIREAAVRRCVADTLERVAEWCGRHEEGDHYFHAQNSTDLCMGHTVVSQGVKRFQVSRSPVSVHLPLHRFLAKVVTFACYGNTSLRSSLAALCAFSLAGRVNFVDYPLRCFSFAAQNVVGMWRRNGATAANLAYNYARAPLSKSLRDMDLVAAQLSVYALSPDSLLGLAVDRFELAALLNNYQTYYASGKAVANQEYAAPLLAEFLRFLIHLVVCAPVALVQSSKDASRPTEGIEGALARELVHHVLSGAHTAGQLQKIKIMVGSARSVSDVMLSRVVDAMCVRKEGAEEGDAKTLSLRLDSYLLYDPEYMNLSSHQASAAADRIRERLQSALGGDSAATTSATDLNQKFVPLLQPQALPAATQEFVSLRCLIYRPIFFTLLHRSLRICLDNAEATATSRLAVIGRVVYLVTLQILCRDTPLHREQAAEYMSGRAWTSGADFFADAFRESDDGDVAGSAGVPMVRTSSNPVSAATGKASSSGSDLTGAGRQLLVALAEVWTGGYVKDDVLYRQGLGWVLQQVATNAVGGLELLRVNGLSFDNSAQAAESDQAAEKRQKKLQAQQRAIAEAQKRAAAFAAMSVDSDEEEEEDLGEEAAGEPECIVCREKKSDSALGFLCLLQPSTVLRNTATRNLDCPELNQVHRVVAMSGCDLHASRSASSKVVLHLHQSDHVLVSERVGSWVHVSAPMSGWCQLYVSGEELEQDGSGGPRPSRVEARVNLSPVSDLLFNKHGGARLHVSQCGHTMHFDCWSLFYAAKYVSRLSVVIVSLLT